MPNPRKVAVDAGLSLFGCIHPLAFFAAFGLGLLLTYMVVPPPEVVIKFPTPYNAMRVTYRGEDRGCYKYRSDEVPCPLNPPETEAVRLQPV